MRKTLAVAAIIVLIFAVPSAAGRQYGGPSGEVVGTEDNPPLSVAILWKMHIPLLKSPEYETHHLLPRFRQAALKDYDFVVDLIGAHPELNVNLAVSPSVLMQYEEYEDEGFRDLFTELLLEPDPGRAELEALRREVLATPPHLLPDVPGYEVLADRLVQGRKLGGEELLRLRYLLARYWQNETHAGRPGDNSGAETPDAGDLERELSLLLERGDELICRTFRQMKELAGEERVEVLSAPLHSPILPLLLKRDWEEDVRGQIERGIEVYREHFPEQPRGFFPPGGAVCGELPSFTADQDLLWLVTDTPVLNRAGFQVVNPDHLYRPYMIDGQEGRTAVIFRDADLSYRLHSGYRDMSAEAAVNDFIGRLHEIQRLNMDGRMLVTVTVESGSFWRYFPDEGRRLRRLLLKRIIEDERLETVTLTDFLRRKGVQSQRTLRRLPEGSRAGDFSPWTEAEGALRGWELLEGLRGGAPEPGEGDTMEDGFLDVLYRAQAGDWFLAQNRTGMRDFPVMDRIFRDLLLEGYRLAGLDPEGVSRARSLFFSSVGGYELDLSDPGPGEFAGGVPGMGFAIDTDHIYLRLDPELLEEMDEDFLTLYLTPGEGTERAGNIHPLEVERRAGRRTGTLLWWRDLGFPLGYRIEAPLRGDEPGIHDGGSVGEPEPGEPSSSGGFKGTGSVYRADGEGGWERAHGKSAPVLRDPEGLRFRLPREEFTAGGMEGATVRLVSTEQGRLFYHPQRGPVQLSLPGNGAE